MKTRTFIFFSLLFLFLSTVTANLLAEPEKEKDLYTTALRSFVDDLLREFGKNGIDRERFLVQQMRMINAEIKTKVSGVSEIRSTYFERLEDNLSDIRNLKSRLSGSASQSLLVFVNEIEQKIQESIDAGSIDFKRQRVIEDAMQLLYIAEEMVRMDPNARVEDDPEFRQDLNKTKSEFVQSFGQDLKLQSLQRTPSSQGEASIFDVYNAWKRNERIKFHVRWTDIQIIKNRLIRKGSAIDRERMFKRELQHAAEMFNLRFYDLAERSFEEIYNRYKFIGRLDDCLFYKGESNYYLGRFSKAAGDFRKLVDEFPGSSFIARTYKRLMAISYHFEDYQQVLSDYEALLGQVSVSDPGVEEMTLMATAAALKIGSLTQAVNYASDISPNSPYSLQSRYILAEAYAAIGNLEEAENIFKSLLLIEGLEPEFRFSILLKMGYLRYEIADYQGAITYFDQIAGSYSQYDRVLIGYGWSYYNQELMRPTGQQRDFTYARRYLEILLDSYYGSDYLLEARTLLGYIYQLEQDATDAIENYRHVFNAKEVKTLSDQLNEERDRINRLMQTTRTLEQKALAEDDREAFERSYQTRQKLAKPLIELNYMDLSSAGVAVKNEVNRLNSQLDQLNKLKAQAEQKGQKKLVDRIEAMQLKIYRAINAIPVSGQSKLGLNYFDENPLARKASVVAMENAKLEQMRSEARQQHETITQRIAELDYTIEAAKKRKDYKRMIALELSRERFQDLLKKVDYLETSAFAINKKEDTINLDYWSDYGAFGLTNVKFAIQKSQAEDIAYMQKQIEEINKFLNLRKQNIEHKIAQLDDEITVMTRRVREQERMREREELNRQFQETYFDTHDTEYKINTDTTNPPKVQENPKE